MRDPTLAALLEEQRETIVRSWARGVIRDVARYRSSDPVQVRANVRELLDAVTACLRGDGADRIRQVAARLAREGVEEDIPIQATLEALRRGAALLREAAESLAGEDRRRAVAAVEEAFHRCVMEYGEAYAASRFESIRADRDAWMERWRTLVEGSPDAILFLDHEGTIRSWNAGATALFGYREGEILGKPFTVLLPDELREAGELARLEKATASGAAHGYETVRTDRHGHRIPVELSRHVVYDGRGRRIGVTEIMRDLRARWEREASRLQAERLAVIGAMSARLAHEIRNPLGATVLNLEMLREEISSGDPAGADELLEALERELRRVERVLEDYLRFARMPSPRKTRCDLRALIEDLVLFLGGEATARGIELVDRSGNGSAVVVGDAEQLRQAFLNLVRNAIEAVETGGRVELDVRAEEGRVVVEIRDDGCGIPDEVRERMFEPFFSRKPQGTGLGLPLAQQVVMEHGGRIECDSRVGEGTRFTVSLPGGTA